MSPLAIACTNEWISRHAQYYLIFSTCVCVKIVILSVGSIIITNDISSSQIGCSESPIASAVSLHDKSTQAFITLYWSWLKMIMAHCRRPSVNKDQSCRLWVCYLHVNPRPRRLITARTSCVPRCHLNSLNWDEAYMWRQDKSIFSEPVFKHKSARWWLDEVSLALHGMVTIELKGGFIRTSVYLHIYRAPIFCASI